MKLFTAEEMRNADKAAAEAGIAPLLLMETAGQRVAAYPQAHFPEAGRILVLCGKGNNGGDGYVAARHLQLAGNSVTVLELATTQAELATDDARTVRLAWLVQGGVGLELNIATVQQHLLQSDLIVDALFGSGLSRPLTGELAVIVEAVNESNKPVLSVDLPSGISSDEAHFLGKHIQATRTLQLAGAKRSSALYPAAEAYGSWEVADIGIPQTLLEARAKLSLLTEDVIRAWLPQRARDVHKYQVGTLAVIAGSEQYLGAAELSCRAAYRAGAGLVTLAAEARLPNSWPEIVFAPLQWDNDPLEAISNLDEKRQQIRLIGPGLDERARPYLAELIGQTDAPTVLDAGALAGDEAWFTAVRQHGRCVLTPHAGEASSLLETSADEITRRPLEAAAKLAKRSNAVVVLKGASSVIATADGRLAISNRGHPGLATGGTGDVLAGIIGSFLANSDRLFERVCAAVFVHGLAGEMAAKTYGYGLIADDVIRNIARAVKRLDREV